MVSVVSIPRYRHLSLELQTKVPKYNYILSFTIAEKTPTRAFSWLKAPSSTFSNVEDTIKTLCKIGINPWKVDVKLGHKTHKGPVAIRHYANQSAHSL